MIRQWKPGKALRGLTDILGEELAGDYDFTAYHAREKPTHPFPEG